MADLGCGAHVLGRPGERRDSYCCGCKSKKHSLMYGQKEVWKHVSLVLAARKGVGVLSE